ncbi:fibrillin-3 isoform X2 [Aplysia californica]|uniref:Fibrillin-3 isoform X2 n=1 Tax=Aplysia californica TaxID=6500 RepID=A0ABM1A7Z0_APLCA|nr:fibrillin-3 isoform X2 [Aplysia californica]
MVTWHLAVFLCMLGGALAAGKKNVLLFESERVPEGGLLGEHNVGANGSCANPKFICSGNSTCCQTGKESFMCCPFVEGVCCMDRLHCCPKGSHCDVPHKRCFRTTENGVEFIAMEQSYRPLERKSAKNSVERVVCPGGTSYCPNGTTCCQLASGQYGCCPLPQATCCSDHLHCCPNGYKCDVAHGKCLRGGDVLSWFNKEPATEIETKVEHVVCPGGTSYCPDGTTCCQLASGQYGCCPLPQATCCSDHLHCCPNGYKCDVAHGKCLRGGDVLSWFNKEPATEIETKVEHVVCPGGTSYCPDGTTCCQLASGLYGCCPLPQATCCSDHLHCCPNGYKCDVAHGKCLRGGDVLSWFNKEPATEIETKVEHVVCPGGTSYCPDGTTCCQLASGLYGCCPLPQATCCSDHLHCCPNGYKCDVAHGKCLRGGDVLSWFNKEPATEIETKVEHVVCPGGTSYCPDGTTCCQLASGQYGCCPLPQATCCSDHLHCCPNGYKCDVAHGKCLRGGDVLSWFNKEPATEIETKVEHVVCPGGTSYCPDGTTCCQLASGQYGCCPLPQATCCSDHLHCCPNGYKCDVAHGKCLRGGDVLSWFNKEPATEIETKVEHVVCPGGTSYCPDGTTCCQLASGQYGCCPLPQATCCSDHLHCCPNGYKCDVAHGKCLRGGDVLSWFNKEPATEIETKVEHVVCPGGTSYCPDGTTCCQLASGQYGCCPLPQATCCSDHLHCCPNGYKCDVAHGKCLRGGDVLSWFNKEPATEIETKVEHVVCPGGTSYCPDGTTCCQLASGQYGCCPLPQATCCSDHLHCCPNGYKCDVAHGKCLRGGDVLSWFNKEPATEIETKVEHVVCPGGTSYCPDGTTCCQLASGQYGCCPLPQATCCSDHLHCCPNGYKCDVAHGKCLRGGDVLSWFNKEPATEIETKVEHVVCPGGTSYCPDGTTCCQLASGQYGCCPLPQATCCSDHLHCCPNGYKCDVAHGKCLRGGDILSWMTKKVATPISPKAEVDRVVCPGGSSFCPDGSTCCQLSSGQYGCCPRPSATCCSDHLHCCPNGYKCDVAHGKCIRGGDILSWFDKEPATEIAPKPEVEHVVCPGGTSYCPDGTTCCQLASGQYGCCPLPSATCCSDHLHCCPNGYKCDVAHGKCIRGGDVLSWFNKEPATPVLLP